jgi:hypothetical protein
MLMMKKTKNIEFEPVHPNNVLLHCLKIYCESTARIVGKKFSELSNEKNIVM